MQSHHNTLKPPEIPLLMPNVRLPEAAIRPEKMYKIILSIQKLLLPLHVCFS